MVVRALQTHDPCFPFDVSSASELDILATSETHTHTHMEDVRGIDKPRQNLVSNSLWTTDSLNCLSRSNPDAWVRFVCQETDWTVCWPAFTCTRSFSCVINGVRSWDIIHPDPFRRVLREGAYLFDSFCSLGRVVWGSWVGKVATVRVCLYIQIDFKCTCYLLPHPGHIQQSLFPWNNFFHIVKQLKCNGRSLGFLVKVWTRSHPFFISPGWLGYVHHIHTLIHIGEKKNRRNSHWRTVMRRK